MGSHGPRLFPGHRDHSGALNPIWEIPVYTDGRPPRDFVITTPDGEQVWHWTCAKFILLPLEWTPRTKPPLAGNAEGRFCRQILCSTSAVQNSDAAYL